jgi:plasmid stabilization system protein ParE
LKLVKKGDYIASLKFILTFIAEDKPKAALDFLAGIDKNLHILLESPYMYRHSIYFEEACYRDYLQRLHHHL